MVHLQSDLYQRLQSHYSTQGIVNLFFLDIPRKSIGDFLEATPIHEFIVQHVQCCLELLKRAIFECKI